MFEACEFSGNTGERLLEFVHLIGHVTTTADAVAITSAGSVAPPGSYPTCHLSVSGVWVFAAKFCLDHVCAHAG